MFKDAQFGTQSLTVSAGDRFFIYTDGLVESAERKITWASGADSLLPVYREVSGIPYEKAPGALIDHLFGKDALPEDDIVVLCVEV
jgi:sigma-B regulation protein RsbU (phosphoserine phosphatase)